MGMLVDGLTALGYDTPTSIQKEALHVNLVKSSDIIGASATGSGKTLAFGIPIVQGILDAYALRGDVCDTLDRVGDVLFSARTAVAAGKKVYEYPWVGAMKYEPSEEEVSDDRDESQGINMAAVMEAVGTEGESGKKMPFAERERTRQRAMRKEIRKAKSICERFIAVRQRHVSNMLKEALPTLVRPFSRTCPVALIIAPTRELAIQCGEHLRDLSRFATNAISVGTITGGMASVKQERVLASCPEIVVATPGRLWDLIDKGTPYLKNLSMLSYLVIDEADQMIAHGHFPELLKILDSIRSSDLKQKELTATLDSAATASAKEDGEVDVAIGAQVNRKRMTMVYSATLLRGSRVMESAGYRRKAEDKEMERQRAIRVAKKSGDMIPQHLVKREADGVDELLELVPFLRSKSVVDLAPDLIVSENILQSRIRCTSEERDVMLYGILALHTHSSKGEQAPSAGDGDGGGGGRRRRRRGCCC